MYNQNERFASITNVVQDFMFIEITSFALQNKTFEYKIFSEDDKLIRKGYFEGPVVQLRLSLMEEGKYSFLLYMNGEQLQYSDFEKKQGFGNSLYNLNDE